MLRAIGTNVLKYKYIRLHDLRHTNATLMLSYGINPKVAQQRLEHASISITMIFIHM